MSTEGRRVPDDMPGPLWIFAYGSIIWRPGFEFVERRVASVPGYTRRFWQGSTDHRGVPDSPGRVVTLVPDPRERCLGVAFRIHPHARDTILAELDHREKGGYTRTWLTVEFEDAGSATALTYLAAPGNPDYLGPQPLEETAAVVRRSHGPSGANIEYVLELADALERLGAAAHEDVFRLATMLRAGAGEGGGR